MIPVTTHLLNQSRKLRDALVEECMIKHELLPNEPNLNQDYHVEVTLTVGEVRQFVEAVDAFDDV